LFRDLLNPREPSPGDCVHAGLADHSCSLLVLPTGPSAGDAALQGEWAVMPESQVGKALGRSLWIIHLFHLNCTPTLEGSTQTHSLTHCPMPFSLEPRENPSIAEWHHGCNLFSLLLTSRLEEQLNLKTPTLGKSPLY